MSIKAAILDKNQGNEVDKNEYTNLIMDDMPINTISDDDKTFSSVSSSAWIQQTSKTLQIYPRCPNLRDLNFVIME